MYKGTKSWNTWHTVTIEETEPWDGEHFMWRNVAGAKWTLKRGNRQGHLDVGLECTYYKSGFTHCRIILDQKSRQLRVKALMGPWDERYDKVA